MRGGMCVCVSNDEAVRFHQCICEREGVCVCVLGCMCMCVSCDEALRLEQCVCCAYESERERMHVVCVGEREGESVYV